MPVYEFTCTKCGERFEVTRPMSKGSDPASCPKDGAEGRRLWTASLGATVGGKSLQEKLVDTSEGMPQPPPVGQDPHFQEHGHGHSHGPGGHTH